MKSTWWIAALLAVGITCLGASAAGENKDGADVASRIRSHKQQIMDLDALARARLLESNGETPVQRPPGKDRWFSRQALLKALAPDQQQKRHELLVELNNLSWPRRPAEEPERRSAADLEEIDRTLEEEPAYQSRSPKYCLLVFGPEARTRIWLVHDGDVMHVRTTDPSQSRDVWRRLKGSGGHFQLGGVIEEDGKTRHADLRVNPGNEDEIIMVNIAGKGWQRAGQDRLGRLAFAVEPELAPVVHFNGPLTIDLFHEQRPLRTGANVRLSAVVGTPGWGPGTFALFCVCSYPDRAFPKAVVEFPSKGADGKPITAQFILTGD